jgi:hypothetical protein
MIGLLPKFNPWTMGSVFQKFVMSTIVDAPQEPVSPGIAFSDTEDVDRDLL